MKKSIVNIDRVQRLSESLDKHDLRMLITVADFLGEIPDLQVRLLTSLSESYDHERARRIQTVIRKLNSEEVLWLCDNADKLNR